MSAARDQVRVVCRTRGPFTAVNAELLQYRDLLMSFLRRDLALRYRQTLLGPLWVILQPLLGAGVFTFLFTSVATIPLPEGVPYFVFALLGLAMWTAFSQALSRSTASLLGNRDMVSKIYFPRLLLPLAAAGSALVDALVVLVVALVTALVSGVPLSARGALAVPVLLTCFLFAFSVGTGLAGLLSRFRDVAYGLPVLVQALLFLTPVLYPLQSVPASVRGIVELNPLTFLFEALRWATIGGPAPTLAQGVISLSTIAITLVISLALFSHLDRDLPDVI